MNVRPLVCCRCGGPLERPASLPALVDCLYCGTVNATSHAATQAATDGVPWEVRKAAIAKFTEALVEALKAGRSAFDAVRACSAAHLGVAGQADTVARIAIALARDFEREASVSVMRDAMVFSRIAQSYLLALDELRTNESYDLNLPFITANANGPVHLRRTLTAKLLAELAARDPNQAAPVGAGAPEAPKKKGWWPF